MKKALLQLTAYLIAWTAAVSPIRSAPMRPIGPMDITGTVQAVQWVAKHEVKARIPGASGTLGIDRMIGAHFLITLRDYAGPDEKMLAAMSRAFSVIFPGSEPPDGVRVIGLKLNTDDPKLLRAGMKIRVTGYAIGGDEGATWTSYKRLEILSAPECKN
ncbi:MAG: hypothetical protein HZA88_06905 [Verrucomicrobia bacterium]|nr:hypothetical protein [Verrucomicrobiota bacterium]